MTQARCFTVRGKDLQFPTFMPDGTYGYVRALTGQDLRAVGLEALMMNSFHLMQKPGSIVINALGGLHQMASWDGVLMTDSGGFQAYSLISQNPKFGSLNEKGITFFPEASKRKLLLTPEKSIQLQMSYGSDIMVCLDECTHIDASRKEQERSVDLTIDWAKRARKTYDQLVKSRDWSEDQRPLIFGVIQGGGELDLRKRCAEALLEIGFDGFGFGGWPLDSESNLISDILEYTRSLIPSQFPIHALGIGHPTSIVTAYRIGYEMFDCALPTRDARHGRLYARKPSDASLDVTGDWLKFVYINSDSHIRSNAPISETCDCLACQHYSLGYLYHLYRQRDANYQRLATMHNLRFMTQLTDDLRKMHV